MIAYDDTTYDNAMQATVHGYAEEDGSGITLLLKKIKVVTKHDQSSVIMFDYIK